MGNRAKKKSASEASRAGSGEGEGAPGYRKANMVLDNSAFQSCRSLSY